MKSLISENVILTMILGSISFIHTIDNRKFPIANFRIL
jgi:hypothetical protein